MTFSTDRPHIQSRYLVLFTWGSPLQQERWANWDSPINGYKKVPKIEFRFPENVGDLEHKELQIEIVRNAETSDFIDFLGGGAAVPPVSVDVLEQIPAQVSGDQGRFPTPFKGRVSRLFKNAREKRGIYRIEAVTAKQDLEIPLGHQCNLTCGFRLFGRGCSTGDGFGGFGGTPPQNPSGPQFGLETRTAGVVSISGYALTVSGGWSSLSPGYEFRRGYLTLGGLNIDIWDWNSGTPNTFVLTRPAPASWIGQTVRMVPGCDQTLESCQDKGNEDNFGGFGIKMPDYDPSFEDTQ